MVLSADDGGFLIFKIFMQPLNVFICVGVFPMLQYSCLIVNLIVETKEEQIKRRKEPFRGRFTALAMRKMRMQVGGAEIGKMN